MQFFAGGLGMLALLPFAIYAWRMPTETIGWVLLFVMGAPHGWGITCFHVRMYMPVPVRLCHFPTHSSYLWRFLQPYFSPLAQIFGSMSGRHWLQGSGLIIWWREKQNNPQDT
jgi:hypothetical protein